MKRPGRSALFNSKEHTPPTLELETRYHLLGLFPVAGCDEAGRGPLAGPVVAAAAILPSELAPDHPLRALRDSKTLTPEKRSELYSVIMASARDAAWALCDPGEIDRMNILAASLEAMSRAVAKLRIAPRLCLVDGSHALPGRVLSKAVVKGDRLCLSIAAASIVAKVVRDRIMEDLHCQYPVYGFDVHKGYPTEAHKQAIARHGPCPAHRFSFRGVAAGGPASAPGGDSPPGLFHDQ